MHLNDQLQMFLFDISKKANETGGGGYILGKVNNKHVKSVKTPLKS